MLSSYYSANGEFIKHPKVCGLNRAEEKMLQGITLDNSYKTIEGMEQTTVPMQPNTKEDVTQISYYFTNTEKSPADFCINKVTTTVTYGHNDLKTMMNKVEKSCHPKNEASEKLSKILGFNINKQ